MSSEKIGVHARENFPLLFSNPNCGEALPRNPRLDIPEPGEKRDYPVACESDFSGLMICPSKGWFPFDVFETLFLARETEYTERAEKPDSSMLFEEPKGFRRARIGSSLWDSCFGSILDRGKGTLDPAEISKIKERCRREGGYVVTRALITAVDPRDEKVCFVARRRAKKSFGGDEGKLDMPGGKVELGWGFGPSYGIGVFQRMLQVELEEETGELAPGGGTKKGFVVTYLERPGGAGVIDFTEICVLHYDNLWRLVATMNSTTFDSVDRGKGYSPWNVFYYGDDVGSDDFFPSTAFALKRLFEDSDPLTAQGCEGMTALVLYDRLIIEHRGLMLDMKDLHSLPKLRA